jgi:hypothetical protein
MKPITKVALKWFDMEHAPKNAKILTFSQCGKYIITSWIEEQGRWNLYTKDKPPLAWFFIPEPLKLTNGGAQALPVTEE